MGYYMRDNCQWLWLCFRTAQGPMKMKPLPYYCQGNWCEVCDRHKCMYRDREIPNPSYVCINKWIVNLNYE